MKRIIRKTLFTVGVAFAVLTASVQGLMAAGGTESFNVTNRLVAGETTATGNPTNAPGVVTGGPIWVDNYTQIGITVAGASTIGGVTNTANALYNPASNFVYVALVRAMSAGPPTSADWETTPFWSFKAGINGTTRIVAVTNLDASFVSPARWIGVYAVSNTCLIPAGAAGVFTNSFNGDSTIVRVTKKIIPITYP